MSLAFVAHERNIICSAAGGYRSAMANADLDTPDGRLEWARKRVFENRADFARKMGVNPTTYRAYENGQNGFAKLAGRFGAALGVSAEWLLEGGPTPKDSPPPRPLSIDRAPDLPPPAASGETVEIVQLDLSLPMGPGATVDDYIEETPLRFDLDYVRGFTRTPPHRLRIARGVGDSMFPTLLSSDLVWIDSTQTTLNQQDRVWAVSINGAAAIKRLRRLKDRVLIISDNPGQENYEVGLDEILIGGRVIRFARDL